MKFADLNHTIIDVGNGRSIPVDINNADYLALIDAGGPIGGYAPPAPNADDVRAEASRRMQALVRARDAGHLAVIIANASREAIRLQNLRLSYLSGEPDSRDWTAAETARAVELKAIDAMFEEIRAASNVLEILDPVPTDFASNSNWPAFGA